MRSERIRHIAALGSSYAAGPGIEPIADRRAHRSSRNYPHLLAERLDAALTDLTISGSTTETITSTPQRFLFRTFAPQLDGLPADADLVTITVGGNDLHYISSMVRLGLAGRFSSRPLTRPLGAVVKRRGVPRPSKDDIDRTAAGLAQVVKEVRGRAKGARVLLVDYLTVVGPDTGYGRATPFDAATLADFRRLGGHVADVFTRAATRTGAELVGMGELSRDHALGSPQPWVTGLPERLSGSSLRGAFHPNSAGMQAVADAIADHL
ncbi:SGNH/GDSL hydrolase family protein [Streptomyces caniscabiei]|uniref:SGNH/GDSL hydrolase family protein n=1 Tax=Streptomyces caniscabiei TaxID=2746961 RepID=A0A927QQJ2_9ACTN|nr:SGNH/GDSL hydrolase family protein [Streptomyces caniscabiei]MBD9729867.1 SGNH/GDSL hydrolase family protein [Streptomyces caniscabiei]MDX3515612.1 SGNH/GDSL hydrolase family protein [Streptomyces caniscabiei]MDX3724868.1 SGNH/GDSL hydrolase family protein [Streptomyces caniscabiei]WEO21776.1 SGNH/GDSL hydrolase family protein [Streptomyces caniscabiei]